VVCAFDPEELFGLGGAGEYGFHDVAGTVYVVIAADKKLGLIAAGKEAVGVVAASGAHGDAESDEAFDARVAAAGAEADVRAEGEAGEEDGLVEAVFYPGEGGFDVILLAAAFVVYAFAEAGAAKVEAEYGNTEGGEGLHGVVDDLVVHGAAAVGVGMADERGEWSVVAAGVEKGFEPAGWTMEVFNRFDMGCVLRAGCGCHGTQFTGLADVVFWVA